LSTDRRKAELPFQIVVPSTDMIALMGGDSRPSSK